MKFSHFFIKRPIFAGVLSLLIFLLGLISMRYLPISEYPQIIPPTIVVQAMYPGANPNTIAETVAAPLEQAINGVENSLYMFSQSTSDGMMSLTVTFKLGTDIDAAQVQVQNRVSQALPKLPEETRRFGVTTIKQSPDLTMVVHLLSPNGRYDEVYLRNYASLQVKDVLARIPGAGSVQLFGSGDYAMRLWLDPDKVAARGLTASDVIGAIREQNVQVAAGSIGQQPAGRDANFELQINTKGRLVTPEEFGEIIVRTGPNGEKTQLKDVARVELGASGYSLRSQLNNKSAVAVPIFQSPGANALQLSEDVRNAMEELKKGFPDGVEYSIVYDPTVFVRDSIKSVIHTLLEAIVLVVIVVVLFLQTWRASIIPLVAVPVSLIGTFAIMHALGFSINNLSLFGLVLAIGIVVDDAIVVVENVERNISLGLNPVDATRKAMDEVTGPIIAIALVLCAVFIPTAFISGLTGQFYKQFAVTIAISTVISAFSSLTLSPALAAALLHSHDAKKDVVSRLLDTLLGWFFRPFNRFFDWAGRTYSATVAWAIRLSIIVLIMYGGLVFLTGWSFNKVATGFVPTQDKQYLVAFAQLPNASSLDRTTDLMQRMSDIALKTPGVKDAISFPGLSISGFSMAPNAGIIFIGLQPFEDRKTPNLTGDAITAALNAQYASIQEAFVLAVMPPPVNGMSAVDGFKLYVEDRNGKGYDDLFRTTRDLLNESRQDKQLANILSFFTVDVPQLNAVVDRVKAKTQGVPLQNLFETMQIYLGSLYVNDFNLFGRTYQVIAQADAKFRSRAEDVTRLKTRNAKGEMVPLGSLVTVTESYGPDRAMRYNGYPAAEITGQAAPGFSSGQAEAAMAKLASEKLPKGYAFEWTDLTYQRILAGNTAVYIYPLCILLVFLVLAAQYESFRLPIAIILVVPLCLLFAIAGVYFTKGDNNVFTQIGFIVLIGLACKNAILIVEFAKVKQDEGMSAADAAIEACRLRLRPILMTSIAFIAGVFPLVISTGAGSEMRKAMGTAVFSGMIGVTVFGLFLTPVFYYVLMKWGHKPTHKSENKPTATPPPSSGHGHGGKIAGGTTLVLLLALGMSAQAALPSVGPDYAKPTNNVTGHYKAEDMGQWKEGQPLDQVPKGAWWEVFNDPTLNDLEKRATSANQQLQAAMARVDQARANARLTQGDFFPSLDANPSFRRERFSPNQTPSFGNITASTIRAPLDLSYEIDLWGKVRRAFEGARADAQASLAVFHTILLTLQADVAQNYFALRALDSEIATVTATVKLRQEEVKLTKSRFDNGIAPELDLTRAETELAVNEAEAAALAKRRSEIENALAILVGENPVNFRLPADTSAVSWNPAPPEIPAGLPAALLERRPDVADAERQLAAANARIGVAKASFFPVLSLTTSGGFVSGDVSKLFDWDSRVWSIGPSLSIPLFSGGRSKAELRRVKAAHAEAVANYRQRILVAFAEVENSLAGVHFLAQQNAAQNRAVAGAQHAADLAGQRYQSGIAGYLEVVDANRAALLAQRNRAQLAGQRMITSVFLIKSLGGGWTENQLALTPPPTKEKTKKSGKK